MPSSASPQGNAHHSESVVRSSNELDPDTPAQALRVDLSPDPFHRGSPPRSSLTLADKTVEQRAIH
jgi:hypothetical protein